MTRTTALLTHLLAGKSVSIQTAYNLFGISNIAREVGRLIERPFAIELTRKKIEGKSKYGNYCTWHEYTLTRNKINAKSIKKMIDFVQTESKKKYGVERKMSKK